MSKRSILIQLDPDPQPSVFDRVVAVDAGAEEVFAHGNVQLEQVQGLVHGAIFTRGPRDLHRTAIFIGGSDVALGERLLKRVTDSFIGPMRVSVMLDANGANTTAAAAVLAASRHLPLAGATAVVLAGTGPVGQRAARLLAGQGAMVRLASRSLQRAQAAADAVNAAVGGLRVTGTQTSDNPSTLAALSEASIVIAAGAAGVQLLPRSVRSQATSLRVAIDLNAVPPEGIEGVSVMDAARQDEGCTVYGAIGVGGLKMRIHRAAIARLFEANDRVLDAEAIFELGRSL